MKAKLVEFEKSGDIKKSLKIGFDSVDKYIQMEFNNNNVTDNPRDFWEFYRGTLEDNYRESELIEIIMNLINDLPVKNGIEYIKSELETFISFRGEEDKDEDEEE